ncbi:MAG: hypothetical protein ABIP36_09440 [Acidimicrobiales bacterium]
MVAVLALLAVSTASAAAQEPSTSTPTVSLLPRDIVPEPNSGEAPSEPGDRGGALQLLLLGVVVVVIGGGVYGLMRQSRRARAD